MADAVVQVAPDSTGAKIDNESLTVGANTVMRQRTRLAGLLAAQLAAVLNTAPGAAEYGLVVREVGVGADQGAPRAFATTGWPVNPYGMADTLFGSGMVVGAAAAATIATIVAPPAGTYRVDISTMAMGDGTTAPVFQNMQLQAGATVLVANLDGVGNQLATAPTGNADVLTSLRVTLNGTTDLIIAATAAYGATDLAVARIVATRIA